MEKGGEKVKMSVVFGSDIRGFVLRMVIVFGVNREMVQE